MTDSASSKKKPEAVVAVCQELYLGPVNASNIDQLKMLNRTNLPVRYQDKFYKTVLATPPTITKLAYFKDVIVGNICCREELVSPERALLGEKNSSAPIAAKTPASAKHVYIMTLGVLAAYRNRGIGSGMLKHVLERAEADGYLSIYLHVHTANAYAIDFYRRHGFENIGKIEDYYKRVTPRDCFVLARRLNFWNIIINHYTS